MAANRSLILEWRESRRVSVSPSEIAITYCDCVRQVVMQKGERRQELRVEVSSSFSQLLTRIVLVGALP